ncbi:MAG: ATP-dependent helicase, partial [Lepagella sp.]
MEDIKQFNNTTEKVIDGLKADLQSGSRLSIAAASFSIYAYQALKEELEKISELRFLFTAPTFSKSNTSKQKREFYIPKLNRERSLFGSEYEIRLRNELSQKAIARECAEWIRRKACFKSNITNGIVPGNLTIENGNESCSYMPFMEFTTPELGCEKGNNIATLITRFTSPYSKQFLATFNQMWYDGERFTD